MNTKNTKTQEGAPLALRDLSREANAALVHPNQRPKLQQRCGYTMEGRKEDVKPFGARGTTEPSQPSGRSASSWAPAGPQELNTALAAAHSAQFGRHAPRGEFSEEF